MNTNAKLADIWLIYRCAVCDSTKNLTIVERMPVANISPSLVDAALTNDSVAARRFARDRHLLRSAGAQVLEGDRISLSEAVPGAGCVRLHFAEPLLVRLDHVISEAFGLSRSQLRAIDTSGGLRLDPAAPLSRLRLAMTTTVALDLETCTEFDQ